MRPKSEALWPLASSVMYISQYVLPTEPKHQGLPPDALHRKQHLLYSYPGRLSRPAAGKFSVIRLAGGKGAWDGVCPPPHAFAAQLTRAFPPPRPRTGPPRTLAVQLTRAFLRLRISLHERFAVQHTHLPVPTPADKLSTNALLFSARALSCVRARRQALHERLLFSARTFPPPRLRTGFPRTLCCSAHAPSCACAHGQALRERLLFQHLPASRPRISPPRAPCGLSARTFPRPRPRTGSPRTLCGLSARGSFCRRSSRRRRRRGCRCPGGRGWRG